MLAMTAAPWRGSRRARRGRDPLAERQHRQGPAEHGVRPRPARRPPCDRACRRPAPGARAGSSIARNTGPARRQPPPRRQQDLAADTGGLAHRHRQWRGWAGGHGSGRQLDRYRHVVARAVPAARGAVTSAVTRLGPAPATARHGRAAGRDRTPPSRGCGRTTRCNSFCSGGTTARTASTKP